MKIDSNARSVNLDPREAQFYENPYPTYRELRKKVPTFKWEQYGYWCFARHEDVNTLLHARNWGLPKFRSASNPSMILKNIRYWSLNHRFTHGFADLSAGHSCRARLNACDQKSRVFPIS